MDAETKEWATKRRGVIRWKVDKEAYAPAGVVASMALPVCKCVVYWNDGDVQDVPAEQPWLSLPLRLESDGACLDIPIVAHGAWCQGCWGLTYKVVEVHVEEKG